MKLDDFIKSKHAEVEAFRLRWMAAHWKSPEAYPLEMSEENAGLWDEQFLDFDPYGGPFEVPDESETI